MRNNPIGVFALIFGLFTSYLNFANAEPIGTAFNYQGSLSARGHPASGSYDMRFTLFADSTNGTPVAGSVTNSSVSVSNGLFSVALDFDASAFSGQRLWIEIAVRTNASTGDYTTLTPRQELTSHPFALYALNAASATSAAKLAPGGYTDPFSFTNPANAFAGKFTGDGSGLTNVNYYLDVKRDFGAVGDGAADDTAALQNALNAMTNAGGSRNLRIPAGVYRLTDTLNVPEGTPGFAYSPASGTITISGDGWGATTLLYARRDKPAVSFASRNTSALGITFQDFGLVGPFVAAWHPQLTAQGIVGGNPDSAFFNASHLRALLALLECE